MTRKSVLAPLAASILASTAGPALGAGDGDTLNTDDWLAVLHMTESKDNWRLSVQEMQESDVWAQETYDKYFISQPRLLKEPRVCTANDAN